ncbi:Asp-tRNA(Asn)/Glu-tRNA(Gln) amidotransferase subunit GatB [Patescibacteria group bacterium]|nr:MAG: Asp-tRNA(Asn)/Glu-tRNA(Gln) amidotransferase subunit GatB [Patescibacteria group bacterium]
MADYIATIGLEIHAELKTQTKMFCNSKNDPDEKRPNVNICPVCLGYPGTLPTVNKEAVKHIIRIGLALGGEIADYTEFDRKNYFYPDIPKGYQISQYKSPLVRGGSLNNVAITRVHLEEDTARSIHQGPYSLIDFNRAGIPLMELVTEPVIASAEEASAFAKELQLLLQYLGAGEANMEKGEMRVEANVSISRKSKVESRKLGLKQSFGLIGRTSSGGELVLGTKVEVKNLNSFRAVEKAIAYEIKRQAVILEEGGEVGQETRGWDETKEVTFSQRAKEFSHDYRYFPDPDLPKLILSEIPDLNPNLLKKELPEVPWVRRKRLTEALGVKTEDAEVFVRQRNWGDFFEQVISGFAGNEKLVQTAANYITSDLAGLVKGDRSATFETVDIASKIPPDNFSKLVLMVSEGNISSRGAKDILKMMYEQGGNPEDIAKKSTLLQIGSESELVGIAREVMGKHSSVVLDYKKGKEAALQFLIGAGMKLSGGSANPEALKLTFKKLLSSDGT